MFILRPGNSSTKFKSDKKDIDFLKVYGGFHIIAYIYECYWMKPMNYSNDWLCWNNIIFHWVCIILTGALNTFMVEPGALCNDKFKYGMLLPVANCCCWMIVWCTTIYQPMYFQHTQYTCVVEFRLEDVGKSFYDTNAVSTWINCAMPTSVFVITLMNSTSVERTRWYSQRNCHFKCIIWLLLIYSYAVVPFNIWLGNMFWCWLYD